MPRTIIIQVFKYISKYSVHYLTRNHLTLPHTYIKSSKYTLYRQTNKQTNIPTNKQTLRFISYTKQLTWTWMSITILWLFSMTRVFTIISTKVLRGWICARTGSTLWSSCTCYCARAPVSPSSPTSMDYGKNWDKIDWNR